jgi:hypothetical protein
MLSSFRNKYSITSYGIDHGFFLNVATVIDGSLIKVCTKSKAICKCSLLDRLKPYWERSVMLPDQEEDNKEGMVHAANRLQKLLA